MRWGKSVTFLSGRFDLALLPCLTYGRTIWSVGAGLCARPCEVLYLLKEVAHSSLQRQAGASLQR